MQQPDNYQEDSLIINIFVSDNILAEGKYKFIEYYCTDEQCDCNSGAFLMVELDKDGHETAKQIALIDYTWNEPISKSNPSLSPQFMGSDLAEAGLNEFKKLLINDSNTLTKIKHGYKETREDFKETEQQQANINTSVNKVYKVGRNDLCPCGSGKKYKKCCLNPG